jgi:hypothetical protein
MSSVHVVETTSLKHPPCEIKEVSEFARSPSESILDAFRRNLVLLFRNML